MSVEDIISCFLGEFSFISEKVVIIEEPVSGLLLSKKEFVFNPGVYVFFDDNEVIKVGRHLTNSRKRAYEHIKHGTHNKDFNMSSLVNSKTAKVLLFNVKNPEDYHWVASIEIYLENKLQPLIKSERH